MACLRRAAFEPIQIQGSLGGVPQPSGNFSYLKRPILRTEIAIYQLGYFRSGARLVDPFSARRTGSSRREFAF
jgi:hypothetical protein